MKRLTPIALLLSLALAASTALPARDALAPLRTLPTQPCPGGFPGGYYAYCMGDDRAIILKTWRIPSEPQEVLIEIYATEAAYGQTWRLTPVWYHLQTGAIMDMDVTQRVVWVPSEADHRLVLRFAPGWPGEGWEPDVGLLPGSLTWLPDVGNLGVFEE